MDIAHLLKHKLHHLLDLIYPPRCLCCGDVGQKKMRQNGSGDQNLDLCDPCERSLPWLVNACRQCALPLPDDVDGSLSCGRCLKKTPYFDDSISLFSFEGEVVRLIHLLKFHDRLAVSRLLGELLLRTVVQHTAEIPDCILPVPLHKKRLRQRGFNQSIDLARPLAENWGVILDTHSIQRTRETQSQTGLDAKQRKRNIRGAFEVVSATNYKHVAIIDDVVTTTSTVNELARILKSNGVEKVSVYSIARAPVNRVPIK